jgi:hypothetical protein
MVRATLALPGPLLAMLRRDPWHLAHALPEPRMAQGAITSRLEVRLNKGRVNQKTEPRPTVLVTPTRPP